MPWMIIKRQDAITPEADIGHMLANFWHKSALLDDPPILSFAYATPLILLEH